MVQSVNARAIWTLTSIFRRPGLLVPHVSVSNVSEVNYDALQSEAGIKAIVFDKDNTLTIPYDNALHPAARDGLDHAVRVFGRDKIAILSNSAGTLDDCKYRDAVAIENSLGIAVIRHDEKKPGGLKEVLQHFGLTDPASVCIVGDRVLTDIVFGNLYGLLTIHTLPLCSRKDKDYAKDNWTARLLRPIENAVLYGNWFGGRILRRQLISHKYWRLGPGESPTCREERLKLISKQDDSSRKNC